MMHDGDILLFKNPRGLSRLIAWGTGSPYSHVAVCVSKKMSLAIEAITRGGYAPGTYARSTLPTISTG